MRLFLSHYFTVFGKRFEKVISKMIVNTQPTMTPIADSHFNNTQFFHVYIIAIRFFSLAILSVHSIWPGLMTQHISMRRDHNVY